MAQDLEAKGGRFLQVQGQYGLHSEFQINLEYSDMLSQQTDKKIVSLENEFIMSFFLKVIFIWSCRPRDLEFRAVVKVRYGNIYLQISALVRWRKKHQEFVEASLK